MKKTPFRLCKSLPDGQQLSVDLTGSGDLEVAKCELELNFLEHFRKNQLPAWKVLTSQEKEAEYRNVFVQCETAELKASRGSHFEQRALADERIAWIRALSFVAAKHGEYI